MSDIKENLHYTATHEWIKKDDDQHVTIGITDHAQQLLGDMVYVQLPAVGDELIAGKETAVVESVKAAADVYSPISGKVIEINNDAAQDPSIVNNDPYGKGWLFRLEIKDATELNQLLDAKTYEQKVAADH